MARAAGTLDFTQPAAIMLLMILQVIKDPYALTSRLVEAVPPGSYLAISIPASDIQPEAAAAAAHRMNEGLPGVTVTARSHAEVTRFFDGLELLEPGVVPVNYWRPGQAALIRHVSWQATRPSAGSGDGRVVVSRRGRAAGNRGRWSERNATVRSGAP